MDPDTKQGLDDLRKALAAAELPDVSWCEHPGHVLVRSELADVVVWCLPWGSDLMYKVESQRASHRCGNVKLTVAAISDLTVPQD